MVDDDPGVREALMSVLLQEGYFALPAGGGLQALALAASRPVDLVLLDLNLPEQNGWDTFEQLAARHPHIPVIIATGRPNQFSTALSVGAGALLEKPFDIPTLLQTIAQLLTPPPAAPLAGWKAEFCYYPAGQKSKSHESYCSHY